MKHIVGIAAIAVLLGLLVLGAQSPALAQNPSDR